MPKGTRAAEGQGGKDQATIRNSANINAAMLLLGKGFLVELDRPAQVGTRQPAHSPSWPRSRPPLDPSPLGVQSPPGWPSVREQTRRRRGASTSTVQVSTRNNSSLDRSQITQGALAHVHTDMPGLTGWLAACTEFCSLSAPLTTEEWPVRVVCFDNLTSSLGSLGCVEGRALKSTASSGLPYKPNPGAVGTAVGDTS